MLFSFLSGIFFSSQNVASRSFSQNFEGGVYPLSMITTISSFIGTIVLFFAFRPQIIDWPAMLLAAAFGMAYVTTLSLIMMCYAKGPMGMSNLIIDMSVMIALLFSFLIFKETPTLIQGVAMLLLIFVLFTIAIPEKGEEKGKLGWFLLTLVTLFCNASISIIQKTVFVVRPLTRSTDFTFWSMAAAALFGGIIFFILHFAAGKRLAADAPTRKILPIGAVQGLSTAFAYYFNNEALLRLPSILVFPISVSVNSILLMIISCVFFGEKINLRKGLSFAIGLCGIILLNL